MAVYFVSYKFIFAYTFEHYNFFARNMKKVVLMKFGIFRKVRHFLF